MTSRRLPGQSICRRVACSVATHQFAPRLVLESYWMYEGRTRGGRPRRFRFGCFPREATLTPPVPRSRRARALRAGARGDGPRCLWQQLAERDRVGVTFGRGQPGRPGRDLELPRLDRPARGRRLPQAVPAGQRLHEHQHAEHDRRHGRAHQEQPGSVRLPRSATCRRWVRCRPPACTRSRTGRPCRTSRTSMRPIARTIPDAVPNDYGFGVIGYRKDIVTEPLTSWADFWKLAATKYSGKVTVEDLDRATLGIALKYLGYSANSTSARELDKASKALIQLKPHLLAAQSVNVSTGLAKGEIVMAHCYNYDAAVAQQSSKNIGWVVPSEGHGRLHRGLHPDRGRQAPGHGVRVPELPPRAARSTPPSSTRRAARGSSRPPTRTSPPACAPAPRSSRPRRSSPRWSGRSSSARRRRSGGPPGRSSRRRDGELQRRLTRAQSWSKRRGPAVETGGRLRPRRRATAAGGAHRAARGPVLRGAAGADRRLLVRHDEPRHVRHALRLDAGQLHQPAQLALPGHDRALADAVARAPPWPARSSPCPSPSSSSVSAAACRRSCCWPSSCPSGRAS